MVGRPPSQLAWRCGSLPSLPAAISALLFCGHRTPCFPYERLCGLRVGSMPATMPTGAEGGRTVADEVDPSPLLDAGGAPDAQTMSRSA